MKNYVYVTGNPHKAKYFAEIVGLNIDSIKVDVEEIQSLDLLEVVEHKARQAYEIAQKPVIVEDTKLVFKAMGALPGPLIKWFLDELDADGLCKILDSYNDRTAFAGAAIACFDGVNLEVFESELEGEISKKPAGADGFGWNRVFIPKGSDQTLGEMDEATFVTYYRQVKPFAEVKAFLEKFPE